LLWQKTRAARGDDIVTGERAEYKEGRGSGAVEAFQQAGRGANEEQRGEYYQHIEQNRKWHTGSVEPHK
jgi:hypothetical protein